MLSFFPRDVLDGIWDLIRSVSEGFPTMQLTFPLDSFYRSQRIPFRATASICLSQVYGKPFYYLLCKIVSYILYQISNIIYKISDILYEISYINKISYIAYKISYILY